jgi:glycosyltransferase involved in cell wall biosynthesis
MKICFYTQNNYKGGLDTFIINLVNSWPDCSDEITLVINDSHPGILTIKSKVNRPLRVLTYSGFLSNLFSVNDKAATSNWLAIYRLLIASLFRLFQYPIIFPWHIVALIYFFKKTNFDRLMVINGGYPASLLCRSAIIAWGIVGKKKLGILNFHSLVTKPAGRLSFIENLIDKFVVQYSSAIIGVSNACIVSMSSRREFSKCANKKFIYNGIEDVAHPLKTLPALKITQEPTCLMLATYHPYKGHDYLLDAFREVVKIFPNARLKIFGHGSFDQKNRVIEAVRLRQLEKHIQIGDFVLDVSSQLLGATILVVPSQAYESFGLTIVEAMAHGVPVVATDVGGIPEVIGLSGAGYICSSNSYQEFADAIIKLFSDQNLTRELGLNGQLHYRKYFTSTKMAQQYSQILKD